MFKKAERKKAKLRLALSGTSGSGKTYGALQIAKGIGGKVAVLDTERGSASLYADMMDFDVVELGPPYEPERFIEVMDAAAKAGYDILIIDSITHEWKGAGGMLEIVDNIARAKFRGNSYAAWNEGDKRHRRFIDAMLHSPLHIIVTMRSKAVYVEGERNGKKTIEKQGAAPEQRDGIEYEFTAVLDLTVDGNLAVKSKDRTRLFNDPFRITEETGRKLRDWLESGADLPEPSFAATPTRHGMKVTSGTADSLTPCCIAPCTSSSRCAQRPSTSKANATARRRLRSRERPRNSATASNTNSPQFLT